MQIFALVGNLKKAKVKNYKKSEKSRELKYLTDMCIEQQKKIEKLEKEISELHEKCQKANRQIYETNAPKSTRKNRQNESSKSIMRNSFSILL